MGGKERPREIDRPGRQGRRGISAVKKQAQRQLRWPGEDQNQMKQRLSDAGVARLKGEKGRGREEKKKKRKKEGQLRDIKSMLLLLRIFWFIELGSSVGPDFPLFNLLDFD